MRKSVNVILIVQTILFYSSFFIDFEILFPTHWATLVSLIINPILSLIGLIPAICFKRWLATLGLILYFLSFSNWDDSWVCSTSILQRLGYHKSISLHTFRAMVSDYYHSYYGFDKLSKKSKQIGFGYLWDDLSTTIAYTCNIIHCFR
ncbi:hypothetical protein [Streptococcus pluranimalium]|uniref:hypothetical protein n=1 Tax=Streptococcus pluranimalium TaxID=82348 RepID=UPI003F681ED0